MESSVEQVYFLRPLYKLTLWDAKSESKNMVQNAKGEKAQTRPKNY